jgi:hypothetical protein
MPDYFVHSGYIQINLTIKKKEIKMHEIQN